MIIYPVVLWIYTKKAVDALLTVPIFCTQKKSGEMDKFRYFDTNARSYKSRSSNYF